MQTAFLHESPARFVHPPILLNYDLLLLAVCAGTALHNPFCVKCGLIDFLRWIMVEEEGKAQINYGIEVRAKPCNGSPHFFPDCAVRTVRSRDLTSSFF